MLSKMPEKIRPLRLLLASACALSLTACASSSMPQIAPTAPCPRIPAPPSVKAPLPPGSYSERARNDIATWRQKLTASPSN